MLAYLKNLIAIKIVPADSAYTTIIYPAKGVAIVVHDGLGVAQERSLCPPPAIEPAPRDPADRRCVENVPARELAPVPATAKYAGSDPDHLQLLAVIDDLDDHNCSFGMPLILMSLSALMYPSRWTSTQQQACP